MNTIYNPNSFITFIDTENGSSRSYSFTKEHPLFSKFVELYKNKKWSEIRGLFDIKAYIEQYSSGKVKIINNTVYYGETAINSLIGERIMQFFKEGIDISPLVLFLENLMKNPSTFVRDDLFLFLEKNRLAITEDGGFLGFKLVGDEYEPYYQGKGAEERYIVGAVITFPRDLIKFGGGECNSVGLYVGNRSYWNNSFDDENRYNGDGKMLIVKVFPQDVCSAPHGEYSKIRVCKLEVLSEYDKVIKKVNALLYTKEDEKEVEKLSKPSRDLRGRFIKKQ